MRIVADTRGTTIAVSDLAPEAGQARGTICKNVVDPATHVAPICDAMGETKSALIVFGAAA